MSLDNVPEKASILTKKQRKVLLSDGEGYTGQKQYQMHSRIRNRLRRAIYDFILLYDNWDEINLSKAFDSQELHPVRTMDGVSRAVATFYRGVYATQVPFEDALIDGVVRAEADQNNRRVDVRFGVDTIVPGGVYTNDAAERVTPEKVDTLRIPEMRAILEGLAHSDADISKLVMEGRKKIAEADES